MEHSQVQEEPVREPPNEYNFRDSTKRRRIGSESIPTKTVSYQTRNYKRKSPILMMPTEVLQKILSYVKLDELSKSVRLVNRRFRTIIQHKLNLTFRKLEDRLGSMKRIIHVSLNHTQNDKEIQCMCKLLNINELLMLHHSIIKASIWRYIYNKYQPTNLCMYAGEILDLYNTVLRDFASKPEVLFSPALSKEYCLPYQVQMICRLSKIFSLHFDRACELSQNKSVFYSGCKMLDILDCASEAKRTVTLSVLENNVVMKLHYKFQHAWFVAMEIPEGKPKSWSEEQRLMYMRLRRIVISHTEMHLEYKQYKREDVLRPEKSAALKKPINSVYTGYGEVNRTFFYYGVMNVGAYAVKFESVRNLYQIFEVEENGDENEDENGDENGEDGNREDGNVEDRNGEGGNREGGNREENDRSSRTERVKRNFVPFLGLEVSVELKCPLHLAPRRVIEALEKGADERLGSKSWGKKAKGVFEMNVDFVCEAAVYPRLPTFYHVNLMGRR